MNERKPHPLPAAKQSGDSAAKPLRQLSSVDGIFDAPLYSHLLGAEEGDDTLALRITARLSGILERDTRTMFEEWLRGDAYPPTDEDLRLLHNAFDFLLSRPRHPVSMASAIARQLPASLFHVENPTMPETTERRR